MAKTMIEEMIDAGVHFGHQTHRRNPKMDPYIFGARAGIHILDLAKTEEMLEKALSFIDEVIGAGKQVIFVGTKRQANELVKQYAEACKMPYVTDRWLGGILTNFETISKRLDYLRKLDAKYANQDFSDITKKEKVLLDKEYEVLNKTLGGLRELRGLPGAIFVVDAIKDSIAVREARKLKLPVVALADTNVDPDKLTFPIPSNDDARKAIEWMLKTISERIAQVGSKKAVKVPTAVAETVESNESIDQEEENGN